MATRQYLDPNRSGRTIASRGQIISPSTPDRDSSQLLRPLSDIREITEPSIIEDLPTAPPISYPQASLPLPETTRALANGVGKPKKSASVRIVEPPPKQKRRQHANPPGPLGGFSSDESDNDSSPHGHSQISVPARSSSGNRRKRDSNPTIHEIHHPAPHQTPPSSQVPRSGAASPRIQNSHMQRTNVSAPRTFTREPCAFEIADDPEIRHPRISVQLQVVAPIFVGGGSIEGIVQTRIDPQEWSRQRRSMLISRIAVDLLGVEELIGQHRRSVFVGLATELLDTDHAPPKEMVESIIPVSFRDPHWILKPALCSIPFRIGLPLDVGPAPFRSKTARIRYILSVTVHFSDGGMHAMTRNSQEISVLSTYDPERALRSLPSPLTAFDEVRMARDGFIDVIRMTAGLHRQVWVSGTNLFVDVHISNDSRKHLKKLELSVERDILYYRHAAASTLERSASQARIFQDREQSILNRHVVKLGRAGWNGVSPHSNVVRTCEIDVPRGHATVRCGKFFEVRYFLNVTIGTSHMYERLAQSLIRPHIGHSRYLSVQLPIILIHMNSLDVVPNAVGQVAVAIEEKRLHYHQSRERKASGSNPAERTSRTMQATSTSRSRPNGPLQIQGKAFAAPRQQSLERMRAATEDVEHLGHILDRSPRRQRPDQSSRTANGVSHRSRNTVHRRSASQSHVSAQHKFALHNTPSYQSLGGVSAGSYTVLNGSHLNLGTITDRRRPAEVTQGSGLAHTVKRTMKSMRSLESLRALGPRTITAPYMYSHDPAARQTRNQDSQTGYGLQEGEETVRRTKPNSKPAPLDGGFQDEDLGHPGLARRASRRLRGSIDKGRFEFQGIMDRGEQAQNGLVGWFRDKTKTRSKAKSTRSRRHHDGAGDSSHDEMRLDEPRSGWI